MVISGNIVTPETAAWGEVKIQNDLISEVDLSDNVHPQADWILPGFIDVHLHGIGYGDATPQSVHLMAEQAPRYGLTSLCPTIASDAPEVMLAFVKRVRELIQNPIPGAAKLPGSHLEGPFIDYAHRGGMNENFVRGVDMDELQQLLDAADGTLKIMTLSPELENSASAIKLLTQHRCKVSMGHTGLQPEAVDDFVRAGGSAVCHLFDTFDGRYVDNGVSQVSLSDAVLVDDRLFIELITDGVHVPPTLIKLAIRAAGVKRIVGITDSMCGSGLPDGAYPMTDAGRSFTLKNGDCCRLTDHPEVIVGSCLTQNQAFYNLVERWGFTPVEAAMMTASNAAGYLGIADRTGAIKPGLAADIVVLAGDRKSVKQTWIDGKLSYEAN